MRSFIAFMACTGFIVWAHSCDKRILGVKIYAHSQENAPVQESFSNTPPNFPSPVLYANAYKAVHLDTIKINTNEDYSLKERLTR